MARPREFDRDTALDKAMQVFWAKGFAATSTDDLIQAMGIGRQSVYNAFGDKKQLYMEALGAYQRRTVGGHLSRLNAPASPIQGISDLLIGLTSEEDARRALGCMGVGSVGEFGISDPALVEQRARIGTLLGTRIAERIREGQATGEILPDLDPAEIAGFIQMTMTGLQLAARAGASAADLTTLARFTIDRLRPA
ncbi:AcrR family transcriptional regulator [Sphingomonas kyeonggiensis]|uniref:TetR/AcrR family transcriptional regulator n=1 Tax=Sphingomonas kyeonggiensis TaxID=1268553 RepID=UPI0027884363|nr:TetR/AcrR family transcriptional regulator [Sphingomonas kyeonggiensis]MDQ0252559.1 AcrR family transcriptional regulator [Sphingomonas kyeonggiensis]